ncbi:MAG: hypothetical protein ACYDB1_04415 [Acidiferrobacteraceae bacterium]
MRTRTILSATRLAAFAAHLEALGEDADIAQDLTISGAVPVAIARVEQAMRRGAQRGPLIEALTELGFSRRTAYRVTRLAAARATRPHGDESAPSKARRTKTPSSAAPAATRTTTPHSPVPVAAPPRETKPEASVPSTTEAKPVPVPGVRQGHKAPLEHYPADALPAHITPGMALSTAQKGGRIWIECLPLETHRDAPFGTDAHGQPWAPYGQDAKGRFLNYLGATLGVAGRTGRGHFVGEPDEP